MIPSLIEDPQTGYPLMGAVRKRFFKILLPFCQDLIRLGLGLFQDLIHDRQIF